MAFSHKVPMEEGRAFLEIEEPFSPLAHDSVAVPAERRWCGRRTAWTASALLFGSAALLAFSGGEDAPSTRQPQPPWMAGAVGLAAEAPPCLCLFDIDRTLTGKQGLRAPERILIPGGWPGRKSSILGFYAVPPPANPRVNGGGFCPPTFTCGFWGRRDRLHPQDRRFPARPTPGYKDKFWSFHISLICAG